ncbi:glycoside hydrolase superfamily [Cladochytrium replicatum]|nr:glycoside hydrolase superfamily [Cladochytrium replicatum]
MAATMPINTDTNLDTFQSEFGSSNSYPSSGKHFTPPTVLLVADLYDPELANGFAEIARHCPHQNFVTSETMWDSDYHAYKFNVSFSQDITLSSGKYTVQCSHPNYKELPIGDTLQISVKYNRRIEAFRALGRIFGIVLDLDGSGYVGNILNFSEEAQFETLGVMIDCSRSAVLTVDGAFYLLRNCALMGLNTFQLYTEDTYQINGEPFFGYLRGAYTPEELSAIDNYAYDLGIEVFACIQTLGHLGQMLQWPRFSGLRDTNEVLLANFEETYTFIEKMVDSASYPFRSKRIHIGMDEAHGVGEGRHRQIFGMKESSEVFVNHLQRVNQICKSRGLKPMIWSDMLFTLAARSNTLQSYYDQDVPLSPNYTSSVPDDLTLVFWDYYHVHAEIYMKKIQQHRELGFEPWVAGGIWTWNRLYSALPFTFDSAKACLRACKETGVRNVFVTTWGDDGNEYDIHSALPGILYYGEHGYLAEGEPAAETMQRQFAAICGGRFDDWVFASRIDAIPADNEGREENKPYFPPNVAKWLLWQDPIYCFLAPQHQAFDLERHYEEVATYLAKACQGSLNTYPLNRLLKFPALIARALNLKVHLRDRLVEAYNSSSKDQLIALFHRDQIWLSLCKPFGMEIVELRYGGQRTRLESLADRVINLINGEINDIPEFNSPLLCVYDGVGPNLVLDFTRAWTPSRGLGTG